MNPAKRLIPAVHNLISTNNNSASLGTPKLARKSKFPLNNINLSRISANSNNTVTATDSEFAFCPVCGLSKLKAGLETHVNECLDKSATPILNSQIHNFETIRPSLAVSANAKVMYCVICTQNISGYTHTSKTTHLNTCLDSLLVNPTLQKSKSTHHTTLFEKMNECPYCNTKSLSAKPIPQKMSHLKSCSKKHSIPSIELMKLASKNQSPTHHYQNLTQFLKINSKTTPDIPEAAEYTDSDSTYKRVLDDDFVAEKTYKQTKFMQQKLSKNDTDLRVALILNGSAENERKEKLKKQLEFGGYLFANADEVVGGAGKNRSVSKLLAVEDAIEYLESKRKLNSVAATSPPRIKDDLQNAVRPLVRIFGNDESPIAKVRDPDASLWEVSSMPLQSTIIHVPFMDSYMEIINEPSISPTHSLEDETVGDLLEPRIETNDISVVDDSKPLDQLLPDDPMIIDENVTVMMPKIDQLVVDLKSAHSRLLQEVESEHRTQMSEIRKLHALNISQSAKDADRKSSEELSMLKSRHLDELKSFSDAQAAEHKQKCDEMDTLRVREISFLTREMQTQIQDLLDKDIAAECRIGELLKTTELLGARVDELEMELRKGKIIRELPVIIDLSEKATESLPESHSQSVIEISCDTIKKGDLFHDSDNESTVSHVIVQFGTPIRPMEDIYVPQTEDWQRSAAFLQYSPSQNTPQTSVKKSSIRDFEADWVAECEDIDVGSMSQVSVVQATQVQYCTGSPLASSSNQQLEVLPTGLKPAPDYSKMSLSDLKKLSSKYGARPGSKASMVAMLTKIWYTLQANKSSKPTEPKTVEKPAKKTKKINGDVQMQLKGSDCYPLLMDYVKSRHEVYAQILRFEPIDINELYVSILHEAGLSKCSRATVGSFLDSHGISYITPD